MPAFFGLQNTNASGATFPTTFAINIGSTNDLMAEGEIHVFLNADVVHDQALVLAGIDAVDAGNRLDKACLLYTSRCV